MHKKTLSERDICTKYITPSLTSAGWDLHRQIREEVSFTDGRIYVRGRIHARGEKNARTTSSTTSPTYQLLSSRPKTTPTQSQQVFSKHSDMHAPWMFPLYSVAMATPLFFTTKQSLRGLSKKNCISMPFRHRKNCGESIARSKA